MGTLGVVGPEGKFPGELRASGSTREVGSCVLVVIGVPRSAGQLPGQLGAIGARIPGRLPRLLVPGRRRPGGGGGGGVRPLLADGRREAEPVDDGDAGRRAVVLPLGGDAGRLPEAAEVVEGAAEAGPLLHHTHVPGVHSGKAVVLGKRDMDEIIHPKMEYEVVKMNTLFFNSKREI